MTTSDSLPNILLIMTDQQRWDSLGCYGQTAIQTPNLDRLARDGARFERCYTPNPICTPARASLLTGRDVLDHGVTKLYDVLADDEVLFPELLQEAGYDTALFGKLHVSSGVHEQTHRHPHDGFDIYEYCIEASVGMESPVQRLCALAGRAEPGLSGRTARQTAGAETHPQGIPLHPLGRREDN